MWMVKCAMTLFNSFCSNIAKQVACFLLPPFPYLKIQPRVSESCDTFRDGKTSRLYWEMYNSDLWQWLQWLNCSANNVKCVNYYRRVGRNKRREWKIWKSKLFNRCTILILPFWFLLTKYQFLCACRLKFFFFFYVESLDWLLCKNPKITECQKLFYWRSFFGLFLQLLLVLLFSLNLK